MQAVRAPILGVAIAVALLMIENLGAIAYRDLEQREHAQAEAALAAREAVAAAEAHKRELDALMARIDELDRERDRLIEAIKAHELDPWGNARPLDLEPMKHRPRMSAILAKAEAISREVDQLVSSHVIADN